MIDMNTRAAEDCRDRVHRLGQPWPLAVFVTAREYGLTTQQLREKLRATRRRPVATKRETGGEWWNK